MNKREAEYIAPVLTVDAVIFQLTNGQLEVLLIQRSRPPFEGSWALPGGYNPEGETTSQALRRVTKTKAGVDTENDLMLIEQLYTFDTVARDPRGHAVSVTYMGLGRSIEPELSAATENPRFFPVKDLPELAYDHNDIIEYALERLSSKASYSNAPFALMPESFTLSQLQTAYEAVLGHPLDKRNFRKKLSQLDMVEPTGESQRDGAHRPASLYRFKSKKLRILPRTFD